MRHRSFSIIALVIAVLCWPLRAYSAFSDGDTFTAQTEEGVTMVFKVLSETDKTCQVGNGEQGPAIDVATATDVTVPSKVNGYKVMKLGQYAFDGCSKMTSLTLPEGLEILDYYAIYGCSLIQSITIPASVTTISDYAFGKNASLQEYVLAAGSTAFSTRDGMLLNKSANTLLSYPAGRTGDFIIPDDIPNVNSGAFTGCRLTSLTFPSTVTYVGGWVATSCPNLETLVWEGSCKALSLCCFRYNPMLTYVTLCEGLEVIPQEAFERANIQEIIIPSTVTSIGRYAFCQNKALKSISLTTNCKTISKQAFESSTAIKDIYITYSTDNMFTATLPDDAFESTVYTSATLHVPTGTKDFFQTADGWKQFVNILEEGERVELDLPIEIVERRTVMEEATGTWCGWCVRGIVGMKHCHERLGDKFIGIAIHAGDVMDIGTYYNLEFSGYPSCRIDRASTQYDPSNVNVVVEANRVYPTVDVSVEGHWSNDGKSVIATSLTRFLTRAQGLSIAYVLVADSLTGSSSQWTQRNFYSGSSSNDPDLQAYCEMGSTLPGTVFNDVAVAASYDSNGNNLADALTHFGAGNTEENTYTLALPTSNQLAEAINKDYVYVVAIVTNADGTIANAAKAKVAHMNGIAATNPDRKFDIYSLDGTPVRLHATSTVGLRPGIYVIHDRMDGTMEGSHVLIIK